MVNPTDESNATNIIQKILKCGIYKELHKRNLLSDAQLNLLLRKK